MQTKGTNTCTVEEFGKDSFRRFLINLGGKNKEKGIKGHDTYVQLPVDQHGCNKGKEIKWWDKRIEKETTHLEPCKTFRH